MTTTKRHGVAYSFSPSGNGQKGVITSSELDAEELRMIEAAVNWDSPNRWADNIFELSGRSIFFQSPTRQVTLDQMVEGEYDALQLIGSGGSEFYL